MIVVVLKPDAFVDVRLAGRRRLWFVELDRGTVSTGTLRNKLQRYAEYLATGREEAERGAFPRVVWACDNARRASHVHDLVTTENDRRGVEVHRLLAHEWPPPGETGTEAIN